jgi:hypothetical protein
MKLLLYSFLLGLIISGLAFGQVSLTLTSASFGPLRTGYAVVTPLTGTTAGLGVSETFGEQIGDNLFQASVVSSPLVTLTDIVLNINPLTATNTGIAIVNPSTFLATITLTVNNQQGAIIATRIITIGPQQQLSDFATELFPGGLNFPTGFTGLLFISSDVPVGVVGLAFSGGTFTALPLATQLNSATTFAVATSTPVIITNPVTPSIPTAVTTTSNGVTITAPVTMTSAPITPSFSGVPTPPTLAPTPPTLLPPPTATTPPGTTLITGSASTLVIPTAGSAFATTTPAVVAVPPSFVLPQVATGGGWVTQITIANTSGFTQTVRVDFFNPSGVPLQTILGSTIQNLVIAAGGVATLTF